MEVDDGQKERLLKLCREKGLKEGSCQENSDPFCLNIQTYLLVVFPALLLQNPPTMHYHNKYYFDKDQFKGDMPKRTGYFS